MVAHEPAYEQLTCVSNPSVQEGWLVVDGGVETLAQKEGLEQLLRQVLGVRGVKSEICVRSGLASDKQRFNSAGEGGETFKLLVELRLGINAG